MSAIYRDRALADYEQKYLMTSLGEYLMSVDNSSLDMQLLNRILKDRKYFTRFRLFLLNPDETVDYEIPQEDIILNSGNFSENYQNGQRKNVNISLINIDGKYTPSVNTIWVHHKFRFDIGIEYNDETFWFPRGIYILGNPKASHADSDRTVTLTLIDKFGMFEGKAGTLDSTYEIPGGTLVKDAIEGILTIDNGSGYPFDLKPIIYDNVFDGVVVPYTLRKEAGSNFGELLLDLASVLNAECFYNVLGNLCFISINETISDDMKTVLWDYTVREREYLTSDADFDFENAVNIIQVVGDNIDGELFSATAVNENPESPICVQRIGRRVEYINDSNIDSDLKAQDRANYELRKVSILRTTLTVRVTFNPMLFVNNLITIEDDFYKLERDKFLIQSISYGIGDDNAMTLVVSNITNFR
jgi:hypothetical protein